MSNMENNKICFVMMTYKDNRQANNTLRILRDLYINSDRILISDGIYPDIAFDWCTAARAGERLKTPEHGGKWTERWMQEALSKSVAELFFRIDPDTLPVSTMANIPQNCDLFGHRVGRTIFGGILGFTREALNVILQSGMLLDNKYTGPAFTYIHSSGETLSAQDPILSDIVERLRLRFVEWGEVKYYYGGEQISFVHPVKTI